MVKVYYANLLISTNSDRPAQILLLAAIISVYSAIN